MTELISAAIAHKLANPDFCEGLARYKEEVASAITEAAMGGIEQIQLRIPERFELEIVYWIKCQGYVMHRLTEKSEGQSFYSINWSKPNEC